ncbi:hypothetical protein Tco_0462561 [Tanacetum coccineum]
MSLRHFLHHSRPLTTTSPPSPPHSPPCLPPSPPETTIVDFPSFKFSSSNIMVGGGNGSRVRGRGWWRVPRLEKPDVKLKREFLRTKYDGTVTLDWVSGDAKRLPEDMSIPLLLTRILPLKDLGINVTNGDKDQSINDSVLATGSEPHDDSAFGKPHKYLPIKKEVVIDGKKMVAEEANASQGQCDDNADDWLPAMNYLLKNRISNKIRLEEEGVEGNDAENLNEEFEHLDMTSEINESVNASFMDDQSSEHIWMLRSLSESTVACVTAIKKLHKESLSTRACMERYRISCTAPPKAAPKPSAPAPPSPLLAALFTSELSQPSSSRPKEGMAAVFQEIGSKPLESFFFYF